MIYSSVCLVIQLLLWWGYKYDIIKKVELLKKVLYLLPLVLIVKYHNFISLVFLIGCFTADITMSKNPYIGGLIFGITYLTILLKIGEIGLNILILLIAVLQVLSIALIYLSRNKPDKKIFIGGMFYLLLLVGMLYYGIVLKNIGFIFLVVGDELLAIQQTTKNKKLVFTISNSFYYAGLCYVPILLLGEN